MKDSAPPSTPAPLAELKHTLNAMVIAWRGGATVLGERLTVLGVPKSAIPGAVETVLGIDEQRGPVVVAVAPVLAPAMAIDIARRLTALERSLRTEDLADASGRVIILCYEPPSVQAWRALSAQLGPRGGDVYLLRGRLTERLQPPAELGDRRFRLPGRGEWSIADWIAAGALLLGVLLTLLGVRGMVVG